MLFSVVNAYMPPNYLVWQHMGTDAPITTQTNLTDYLQNRKLTSVKKPPFYL